MKTIFSIFAFAFLLCLPAMAQQETAGVVKFGIKNTSVFPKKITVVSYQPGAQGNGTQTAWIAPKSSKNFSFKEGTKVYLASSKQVDVVMSGQRIDNDPPFLVVKKDDDGKIFEF